LALTADKDDPARLTLSHDKLNLGPRTAEPLRLVRTMTGLLTVDESTHDAEGAPKEPPELALLKVLADFVERGEHVSSEQSAHTNAWKLCRPEPGFPKRAFPVAGPLFATLRQMERNGLIEKGTYANAYRKERQEWLLTAKGWEQIGKSAPTAPTAPTYRDGAPDADQPEGSGALAPTAPTCGTGGVGEFLAQDVGANLPNPTLAETTTPTDEGAPGTDDEGENYEDL
jgi:hypothetical protein